MKAKLLVALLCYLPWISIAEAANRYIADDVHTYLHAGSSNKYRIIGSINAGEPVVQLDRDAQTEYVQIRDADGRVGWVDGQFMQSNESFRSKLPALETQLEETKLLLSTADERHEQDILDKSTRLQQQEQELTNVSDQLSELRLQHTQLKTENLRLTSLMDDKEHQMRLDWLLNGGIVAGIGLLFGIFLPMIPLRRKNKNGRWMN
ncbi:MAG: TIGR04211 family SH3 domain-containing protein [Oceanisphaera sp.]|uniref:TIGR04211 family SH3 domain-containing protein n=1 Tax=Oceanisphaera sp. TaxID=1929979 RepID=UPI003C74D5D0